jgi:hypothetical protein
MTRNNSPSAHYRFSLEQELEIAQKYKDGMTITELAKLYDSPGIYYIIRRYVKTRNQSYRKPGYIQPTYYHNNDRKIIDEFGYNFFYRTKVMDLYGGRCNRCDLNGYKNYLFFCIDHIDNLGSVMRRENHESLGASLYSKLFLDHKNGLPLRTDIQILCYNCNWIKELEFRATLEHTNRYYTEIEKYLKLKQDIISHYSNHNMLCICCSYSDIRALTIDHITPSRGRSFKGDRLYSWLIENKYPEGYQVLCLNCNKAKGIKEFCPHKNVNY